MRPARTAASALSAAGAPWRDCTARRACEGYASARPKGAPAGTAWAAGRRARRATRRPTNGGSANGDGVDHRLDGSLVAGLAEHEQELPRLVRHELGGIHVLEQVGAVARQQFLVHAEDALALLERHGLHAPGIGSHGHHALADEIPRSVHAQAGLRLAEALRVGVEDAHPAGMEQDDVAFADL